MRVEAIKSFQGDFGPGTPVESYDVGQQFEAPARIANKWIGRELVKPASSAAKKATSKGGADGG